MRGCTSRNLGARLWRSKGDCKERVGFCNSYAPRKRTRRKTFFSELLDRDVPTGRDPSLRGIRASSQRGKFELKNWPVR
ncbi:hypothetical protein PC119_g17889 [Phytophthora cactorum]|nr:hypothetical protein PC119_g17889 [Phytophthora cactorum]